MNSRNLVTCRTVLGAVWSFWLEGGKGEEPRRLEGGEGSMSTAILHMGGPSASWVWRHATTRPRKPTPTHHLQPHLSLFFCVGNLFANVTTTRAQDHSHAPSRAEISMLVSRLVSFSKPAGTTLRRNMKPLALASTSASLSCCVPTSYWTGCGSDELAQVTIVQGRPKDQVGSPARARTLPGYVSSEASTPLHADFKKPRAMISAWCRVNTDQQPNSFCVNACRDTNALACSARWS
mmetsp:Transcript_132324/g.229432  ORF Transcript_132324/g.229432 Transcript_132324/m.229432 type:complete len:236 (+) Transcript_132324:1148-1855(+)